MDVSLVVESGAVVVVTIELPNEFGSEVSVEFWAKLSGEL